MKIEDWTNKIINGDCVKVLKELPEGCIDFILTDPPFNVGLKYDAISDNLSNEGYSKWCYEWIKELFRVLKYRHYCIIFTGDKRLYWIFKAIMNTGFRFHHFLKWNKPRCQRSLSGTVFFNRTELAFILSKGKPNIKLINRKRLYQDTLTYLNTKPSDKDAVDHNARRPISLYKHIIEGFTKEGNLILDNFLGSGTTGIASRESNRNFIGIEISSKYSELAKQRIENTSVIKFNFITDKKEIKIEEEPKVDWEKMFDVST